MPPASGTLATVTRLNPLTPLVVTTREWLALGPATNYWPCLWIFSGSVAFLFAGWMVYRLAMPILIERMGN
jgi:lipopolysaccharide transport system permease protein